jgi:small subunit ribosomal protein S1
MSRQKMKEKKILKKVKIFLDILNLIVYIASLILKEFFMSNNKNLENNKEIQVELLDKSDSQTNFADLNVMDAKFEEVHNSMLSEFVNLLQNQIIPSPYIKSRIVNGKIVEINKKQGIVIVDCGLKSEAVVEIREFAESDDESLIAQVELNVGDEYEFYIESFETQKNVLSINRRRVKKEKTWQKIREAFKNEEIIEGIIFSRMKGGFCIDFDGNLAFLPASQARIKIATKGNEIIGTKQSFKVINIDDKYQTCIVSYLAARDEMFADKRKDFIDNIQEGEIVEGVVKSVTNYGVFVDLGIMDGLLHISDITWDRITHPSEVLDVNKTIKLKVIKVDKAKNRVSLGLKQLTPNPVAFLEEKYKAGQKIKGKVTSVTDYGLFLSIESGIEGLVHLYELDWVKEKATEFLQNAKVDDEMEAIILGIDISGQNKISLSRKQLLDNPWKSFMERHKQGDILEGTIKRVESFRLLVSLEGGIAGVVHVDDVSWVKSDDALRKFRDGEKIQVVYLNGQFDDKQSKISLGIKQLSSSPFEKYKDQLQTNAVITGIVSSIDSNGIEVTIFDAIKTYIKKSHISSDKAEQRTNRFAIGDKIDVKISKFNQDTGELQASIRKLEEDERTKLLSEYGNTNIGATIGSALGDALKIHSDDKK